MNSFTAASDRSSSGGVSIVSAICLYGGAWVASVLPAISISWTPALEFGQFHQSPTLCEERGSILFCSNRDVQALSWNSALPALGHRALGSSRVLAPERQATCPCHPTPLH